MIQSTYYGKKVSLTTEEAETLIDLYLEIAEERKFTPDTESAEELLLDENGHLFDTVAYHVEQFGQELTGFEMIEHIFQ